MNKSTAKKAKTIIFMHYCKLIWPINEFFADFIRLFNEKAIVYPEYNVRSDILKNAKSGRPVVCRLLFYLVMTFRSFLYLFTDVVR